MNISYEDEYSARYPQRRGVRIIFTSEEIRSLSIAILVLTFCFSVAFTSNGLISLLSGDVDILMFFIILPISFIAVMTAFVVHEMAHKIVANFYGYPAAFSYSKQGLVLAAVFSLLFGILFAAPGAVFIYGNPTRRQNGIISLAGPLTNLVLGGLFTILFLMFAIFSIIFKASTILASAFFLVASINIFIGAFNMIPVMPFDGAKIWRWSKAIYVIMIAFMLPPLIFFFIF